MKKETLFLRIVVFLIGLPVLAVCIIWLPGIAKEALGYFPERSALPVVIVLYLSALPYLFALYQALRLLSYIDGNNAFSELSVKVLKAIKYCALIIGVLFAIASPFLYRMAEFDDAPGLLAIGLIIISASVVIAVFAAILQRLLKDAIEIKSDNDLTI
jgi:hypothetical protein